MALLDALAEVVGTTGAELRLWLGYYGWLVAPAVIGLVVVTVVVLKVLPRQRRRDDLSGQDRPIH